MFLKPVSWYKRLQRQRQLETVRLPDQAAWCRLTTAKGASALGRPNANVRTALLGISLLFILCTPAVMSSKRLKLIKAELQNEHTAFEISLINGKKTVEQTNHRDELMLPEKYGNSKDGSNLINSNENHLEVMQSKLYADLFSGVKFAREGAGNILDSNVDFNILSKNFDIKSSDGVVKNCNFITSTVESYANEEKGFVHSALEIAPKLSKMTNQKRSHELYYESRMNSCDGGLEHNSVTSLDSVSGVPEEISEDGSNNENVKSPRTSSVSHHVPATAAAAVAFLYCLMRLLKEGSWSDLVEEVRNAWQKTEQVLSAQGNLTTLAKQMIFLSACEKCLLRGEHLSSLYTLMFCSIITYCVGYANELLTRQQWSLAVRVGGPTSSVRHLALSTTNIVLEWTKAVTFITTLVFLLLMLGLEKGLEDYSPNASYIVIAALYWVSTEKVCRNAVLSRMLDWRWRFCDSLEEFYVPLYLQYFQLFCMVAFTLPCIFMGYWRTAICGAVFVRMDYLQKKTLSQKLSAALIQLSQFRNASEEELRRNNDRCSICLCWMTSARVTPCQHFYHAECLLNILQSLLKCPMCQADLRRMSDKEVKLL